MRFTYRDRRDDDRVKIATLSADEFIDRFLHHILPDRFLRIRHYGFLGNRAKQKQLARCRELLGVAPATHPSNRPRTLSDWLVQVVGIDPNSCPRCGCPLHHVPLPRVVAWQGPPPATADLVPYPLKPWDSS